MRILRPLLVSAVLALLASPATAIAQSDEIQVYDGGLAPRGVFNLTWHNNYTPKGISAPAFSGAVVSDKTWIGVTEWALGVTDWFEAGLYAPLYSMSSPGGFKVNGFKLRTLFAVPHAEDRRYFYGANFEFSYNGKAWDDRRFTSEIRPILGMHLKPFDLILNPIVDTRYETLGKLEFVPSARVAYNVSDKLAFSAEEYSDFGTLDAIAPRSAQAHQLFGVVNYVMRTVEIEAGVGAGLTKAADKLQFKLLLIHDFNPK